jgi:hypothetical protein
MTKNSKFSFLIFKKHFIMKKTKTMLTIVALMAIVAGALAFKAKKESFTFYKYSISTLKCDDPVTLFSTTIAPTTSLIDYSIVPTNGHCSVNVRVSE